MEHFRRAICNVVRLGDTDVFPFPIENHVFFDCANEALQLIQELDNGDVRGHLATRPPVNVGGLAPVGYTGFRWATQLDPLWNAAFLGWVLSIADQIEAARLPIAEERVFSYRYHWDEADGSCFRKDIGWRQFITKAIAKSANAPYVVSCDISEFYLRINHHRVENAIQQLPAAHDAAQRIKHFLSNFSGTYSFGLPIGGPASRLLSELILNQIDRLLRANNMDFIRFADDYYIFTDSPSSAFASLALLTRMLIRNQGLQLQKSKTRIMTSAEFLATNPLVFDDSDDEAEVPLGQARQAVMSINVHYDPYSPQAVENYEALQTELDRYPILDLIRAELKKSHVNISLARRLIGLTRYLEGIVLEDTIKTIIENEEILYPVYFNVLITAKSVFDRLPPPAQQFALSHVYELVNGRSRAMVSDINLQYAVRFLSLSGTEEIKLLFNQLYLADHNAAIKADIILAFARWGDWYWLSDLKGQFRGMPGPQQRAFLIASFNLGDEGKHWRTHLGKEFSADQKLVRDWAAQRFAIPRWSIPL